MPILPVSALLDFDNQYLPYLEALDIKSADAGQKKRVKGIFAERWKKIAKGPFSYLNTIDGNHRWICLAQQWATVTGEMYWQWLMPTVNFKVRDPNTLKHIRETPEPAELLLYYLGEDGETLYHVDGLSRLLQTTQCLMTYNPYLTDNNKEQYARPRGLLPRELLQLRNKQSFFVKEKENYNVDFWTYVSNHIFPHWRKSGEIPRQVLYSLFELVDFYFSHHKNVNFHLLFREKWLLWLSYLNDLPMQDLYCLYGQNITIDGQGVYFIDVILDWLQGKESALFDQMSGLARWFGRYDPAFVLDVPALNLVYEKLKIGPFFSASDLRSLVSLLKENCSLAIRKKIDELMAHWEGRPEKNIDSDDIAVLRQLYQLHWLDVCDTPDDPLRGGSRHWLRLAQLLSGSGHIEKNYYRFLMPTLQQEQDIIQDTLISELPLSHCVLSHDKKSLIYLPNCQKHFDASGTFNNCNTAPPSALSDTEILRLKFASRRFHQYIPYARHGGKTDLPLSKRTVMAVRHFVNDSLYVRGLTLDCLYTTVEQQKAEQACDRLCAFINALPSDEKKRLLEQRITLRGVTNVSVDMLLKDIQNWQDAGCIATCSKYFAKLVVDYAKWMRFSNEIEAKTELMKELRDKSQKKVYRDYDALDDDEAKRRLQILSVSLMTHSFQYSFLGKSCAVWDCKNTMVSATREIFNLINPLITSGDFRHARHVYVEIIESIVKRRLARMNQSWLTRVGMYTDTRRWLQSIADGSIFTKQPLWFDPKLLLTVLPDIANLDATSHALLQVFLRDMVRTYAQNKKRVLQDIRVNVKFVQFLESLGATPRAHVLSILRQPRPPIQEDSLFENCRNVLFRYLETLKGRSSSMQFFNKDGIYLQEKARWLAQLNAAWSSQCIKSSSAFREMLSASASVFKKCPNHPACSRILAYLDELVQPIVLSAPKISFSPKSVHF